MKKNFIQLLYATDCEGRHVEWTNTDKTFEEWADKVSRRGFGPYAVREVEKTFNPDTFEITEKEIRRVEGDL